MSLATRPGERRVVRENVSWAAFEALVADPDSHEGRLAYDAGTLEILSPSFEHEVLKSAMGSLIETYAQVAGIEMTLVGSMTLKKQLARRGVEPDESYYVANEPRVRGKREVSLEADPPPDLCIEVQLTRSALDKLGIYAAMGVPEVWLWEADRLKVYWLGAPGAGEAARYVERDRSRVFPGLPVEALVRSVGDLKSKSTSRIVQEFRAWLGDPQTRV